MNQDHKLYEFGFNKKLVTSVPGPSVADNFTELKNLRYTDTHVQSVRGMELKNQTALGGDILSGYNFVNDDSGENYVLAHAITSGAGSAIYRSSSPEYGARTDIDLTTAQFLDEKGSITTFTVDTANTSGHFDAAKGARVLAGCRMVIGGADYPLASIGGDGTGSNAVVFRGTLAAGTYAVQGIFGALAAGGVVALSHYDTPSDTTSAMGNAGSTAVLTARIDKSFTLPNGKTITHIGAYVNVAGNTIGYILRNDGADPPVIDTAALTVLARVEGPIPTTGFGYLQLEEPFVVPDDGTFYLAACPNGSTLSYQSGQGGPLTIAQPVVGDTVTLQTGNQSRCCYRRLDRVYPAGQHYPLLLPAVDCTDWTATTAVSVSETLDSQSLWYALSFDGGTTYSAFVSGSWLEIVQNNAGTWEYWTGSAWAASSINSALGAMAQAAGVTGNRMTGATMAGLTPAQLAGSGGFTGGQTSLPVLAALYSASTTETPQLNSVALISNIQADSGNFEADPLYTCASGDGSVIFSDAPSGAIAACNGLESLIYAGNEAVVGAFVGYDSTVYYDYTEQVRNRVNDADNSASIPDVATPIMYVGATRPIKGFKLYVGSANAVSATVSVKYWDGDSFELVSNATDNTSVGGKTLAVTGTVTFDDTQDVAQPSLINGVMLYWYKLTFSATLTATTRIYHVTVDSPMQPIRDLWDGEPRSIGGFFKYTTGYLEYTGNVYENVYDSSDGGTYVNIGGLTSSQYIYAGFTEKIVGLSVSIYGGGGNTTASKLTVSYWDGDSWIAVSGLVDGTKDSGGTKTMAQSGVITWNPPATQFEKPLVKDVSLYFYRLSVSATLSATVHVFYVTGIPEATDISGHSFPMFANGRLWLLDEYNGNRNQTKCSAQDAPDVFNGADSMTFTFGGSDRLMGGAALFTQFGSSLYNMTVFLKRSEIWAIIGSGPDDWTQFRVSSSTGCCAPGTIAVATINAPGNPAQNQHVLFFQSEDGVYIFDGRTPIKISGDIKNYFSQVHAEAIPAAMLAESTAFYDYRNDEYHLLIGSGQAAEELNVELVYDLRRNKWFEIDRPTGKKIQRGFTVRNDDGFRAYYGASGGSVYALESGQNFDGEDIDWALTTGDISMANGSVSVATVLHGVRLVAGAHTNGCDVDVTLYANGDETGTGITGGFDLQNSGSRVVMADIQGMRLGQSAVYHAIKLSGSVCDAEGIDLYGLGIEYSEAR